uniref:Uncharacterized protein n=1 Tax=Zea mays TaxID=4577 RepID=C0PJR5_MAIZE|nr:unknown [Zea mays]
MNHITFNPQLSGVALPSTKLYLTAKLNMVQDTLPTKLHGKYQLNLNLPIKHIS